MQALASKSPAYFSFPQQWNAQDLADAMPRRLRLSQMTDYDAARAGATASASANTAARRSRAVQRGYARISELPALFRIR
ncbi:hypothetical protein [Luteimonas notoginsengisoli]|jgi:hypothetical protein|uniref:Uncharacterized protein n=1 Tax=Luteimonas notoginsengisoli TaxID=1578200 RepID=A0ABV7UT11_9GAMM